MARNSEKNLTVLNRLYLQREAEKNKKEKRPPLSRLDTAEEIRKWIPSIKQEINFCLRHLSGIRNYPEYKIREFKERLGSLEKEYKRFVSKCSALDPDTTIFSTPGDPHAYISKRKIQEARKQRIQEESQKQPRTRYYKHKTPKGLVFVPIDDTELGDDNNQIEDIKDNDLEPPKKRIRTHIDTPILDNPPNDHTNRLCHCTTDNLVEEENVNELDLPPPVTFVSEEWDINDHCSNSAQNQPLDFSYAKVTLSQNGESPDVTVGTTSLVPNYDFDSDSD